MKKRFLILTLILTVFCCSPVYASKGDSDNRGNIIIYTGIGATSLFAYIFKKERNKTKGTIDPGSKEYINNEESEGRVISTVYTHTT